VISSLQIVGALAVTFGLLAVAVKLLQRLQAGPSAAGRGVPIRLVQRVMIGPKQGVAVLKVGERVLLVSLAESGIRLLTELDRATFPQAFPEAPEANAPASGRSVLGFRVPFLPALALLSVLAMGGAGVARAQVTAPAPSLARGQAVAKPSQPAMATSAISVAAPSPPVMDIRIGEGKDALHLSGTVGLVVFLGAMTLLPAMFLLMTSFTRILIVLHFLRSAMGTQTTPPGQLLVAIAVLLTGVVMNPVLQKSNALAIQPYMQGRMSQSEAYGKAIVPFREFMLDNTRDHDLALFAEMSGARADSVEQLPTLTVISAFVTSELRTAFQMGFVIFLPFVVVDLIVASVLMSLGMFMLPPVMISLPFKLLLFVLADGWTLVVQNLVASFRQG
jgi:flagellar biosynthetic protein FliP